MGLAQGRSQSGIAFGDGTGRKAAYLQDLEVPLLTHGFVQALDHRVALDVVQHMAEIALALPDLLGGEWLFK
jgi:hypothetical protein